MKPDIMETLVNDLNDEALILTLLGSMQDDAMLRLIRACVEMDPEHRHGIAALIEGLKANYEEVVIESVMDSNSVLEVA
ncbi:MAG: hypothetical protein MRY59_07305 [Aquisalinus sp.]|nr:hypothetical protein [Aquisalinus sp.]